MLFLLLDMITRSVTYLIKKRLHDYKVLQQIIDHRLDCECDVYDDLIEKRMITISDQFDNHYDTLLIAQLDNFCHCSLGICKKIYYINVLPLTMTLIFDHHNHCA